MRRFLALVTAAAALLAFGQNASAQFGAPAQGPAVEPAGSIVVYPTIGVVHDEGVTEFALMGRGRLSILDEFSTSIQLGGLLGEYNAFTAGLGGKYQFLKSEGDSIVELSAYTALDFAVGSDITEFNWVLGPIVGAKIDTGSVAITPYGGFGLGLIYWKPGDVDGDTGFAFDLIFGANVGITDELSGFTEFDIEPTEYTPILSWHLGVSYNFSPPV